MKHFKILLLLTTGFLVVSGPAVSKEGDLFFNDISFESYDLDNDGFITNNDLEKYYRKKFNSIDLDKNDIISLKEYRKVFLFLVTESYRKRGVSEEDVRKDMRKIFTRIDNEFISLDEDKNSEISQSEFGQLREEKINFFANYDSNNDQKISKNEVKRILEAKLKE